MSEDSREQIHAQGRVLLLTERVRLALLRAGSAGCTTDVLAREIYGECTYKTRTRIVGLVQRLRRRIRIDTVREPGYRDKRYVLPDAEGAARP